MLCAIRVFTSVGYKKQESWKYRKPVPSPPVRAARPQERAVLSSSKPIRAGDPPAYLYELEVSSFGSYCIDEDTSLVYRLRILSSSLLLPSIPSVL